MSRCGLKRWAWLVVCGIFMTGGMGGWVLCLVAGDCAADRQGIGGATSSIGLFERVRALSGRSPVARMEAASVLAKSEDGEAWAVIVVATDDSLGDEISDGAPAHTRQLRQEFSQAVVSSILRRVDKQSGPALLWAVTERLSDNRTGTFYGEEGVFPFIRMIDGRTPPMRDLAREALVRALSVDLEYDCAAWRKVILDQYTR
jgi:hypothetical protein